MGQSPLEAPARPGLSFLIRVRGATEPSAKLLRWSVGHRRAQQDRAVTSPGPSRSHARRVGAPG
jgi:hypothetical protein